MTSNRRLSGRRRLVCLAIATGMVVAACGGDDDNNADTEADTDDTVEAPADADEPATDDTVEPATDDADESVTDQPSAQPVSAAAAIEEAGDDREESVDVTVVTEEELDPVAGGTLRYGLEADVNGINPTASSLSAPGLTMGHAVFDQLAAITSDGAWEPYLAESFTPNEDDTQWTMKLREGISFHDGTPLNADAIVVNFESQRTHPLVGLAVKPYFPESDAITVVDDLTVTFNMLEPNALFPTLLATQLGMVASPTWLAAAAEDGTLHQAPVGTGPFKFESRSEDSVTRFVRNDDWWGGEVYLDAVEFFPVTDPDALTQLLVSGELDALHTTDAGSIVELTADEAIQNILNDKSEESFAMMNSVAPPFDDIRARQALTLATPVDLYNELIGLGVNRPAEQMFTPDSPFYNPDVVQQHDDPVAALALVQTYCAERGDDENPILGGTTCSDGRINVELQWAGPSVTATRIADLLNEAWTEAGFNVTFDELLQDEHIAQTAFGQYNVNTWRQFGALNPINDRIWLMCRSITAISLNWPRHCDETRDTLILDIMASDDQAALVPMYQDLVQKIHDDYLYVFFNHTMWDNAFAENVHGMCDRTTPGGDAALVCSANGETWFDSVWIE